MTKRFFKIQIFFPFKFHGFPCLSNPGAQNTALGIWSARYSLPVSNPHWFINLPFASIRKWNSQLPPWCTTLWIVIQFNVTCIQNLPKCFDPRVYKLLPVSPSYPLMTPWSEHAVHKILYAIPCFWQEVSFWWMCGTKSNLLCPTSHSSKDYPVPIMSLTIWPEFSTILNLDFLPWLLSISILIILDTNFNPVVAGKRLGCFYVTAILSWG